MYKFIKTLLISSLLLGANIEAKVVVVGSLSKPIGSVDKDFDDSEVQFGVALQPYLMDNIALDMRLDSSNANKMPDGGKTDLERMSLNLLYDFNLESGISPYVFAGAGYEKLHRTYKNIKSQSFTNAGVGLKVDINDDIDVRSEVKYIKMNDTKDSDVIASLAFGLKFGCSEYEGVCEEDVLDTSANSSQVKPAVQKVVKHIQSKPLKEPSFKTPKSSSVVYSDEKLPTKTIKKYKTQVVIKQNNSKATNYIQVAALSDKNNVRNIIKKLRNKHLKVKTIRKLSATVVLVGPYSGNTLKRAYSRVKTIQKDAFYKKL